MSHNEKSGDGLVIGILAVFALLVIGGLGLVGVGYVRASRSAMMARDMAEMARQQALQERAAAEAARLEAEALRDKLSKPDNGSTGEDANAPAKSDNGEAKEPQP
jgi:hypothetical protein